MRKCGCRFKGLHAAFPFCGLAQALLVLFILLEQRAKLWVLLNAYSVRNFFDRQQVPTQARTQTGRSGADRVHPSKGSKHQALSNFLNR